MSSHGIPWKLEDNVVHGLPWSPWEILHFSDVTPINTQVLLQGLVHAFGLSVTFRVVTQGEVETDVQGFAK